MPLTTFEISIRRTSGAGLAADATLTSAASAAPAQLAAGALVSLDAEALLRLSGDPAGYGAALAAQLFAAPQLRDAWLKARAYAASGDLQLRLRLDPAAPELHALRWETLRDPETGQPIALHERVRLVRTLDTSDLTPVVIPPRPALRALVVVANPSNLADFHLAEVDVEGEVGRARAALGDIPATILGDHAGAAGRATLAGIAAQLRDAPPIVILVAHGTLRDGQPVLWLEQEDGAADPVPGADFVAAIERLAARPLLIILASCRSAGGGYGDTLGALAPGLARAGVPAVLGFQGDVAMGTVKTLLPTLISELRRDGRIDRALAAARAALGEQRPWWQAALWLRTDGRVWEKPAPPPAQLSREEQRNRETLLSLVRKFWVEGVLRESLHQRVLIELGMQTVPDALHQPWKSVVHLPGQQPCLLAPGTPIRRVFEEAQRQLLILGKPGGGKTTMMLTLTEQLITEAQADPSMPIPVVFQLSTWAVAKPTLATWLVAELKERYKVPPKQGQAWVESGAILPLLDGLDEVGSGDADRAACVQAINSYLKNSGAQAAVCSRSDEYAQLEQKQGAKLALETAIEIQPLEPAQAGAYLARFGPPLAGVREAAANDAALAELARSPLLLSVMALAYVDTPAAELVGQDNSAATRRLWADYVARRLALRRADAQTDPGQLRAWLTWLARGMQAHSQQVFYIEYLQPSWLSSKGQRRIFQVLSFLVFGIIGGLAFGLFSGLAFGLFGLFSGEAGDINSVLGGSLRIGLIASLIIGMGGSRDGITLTETLSWDWRQVLRWRRWRIYLVFSLGVGIIFGMGLGLGVGLSVGLGVGLAFGLIGGLVGGLLDELKGSEIQLSTRPNEGIMRSLASAWRSGLAFALGVGLAFGLVFGPAFGLGVGLAFGLILGLVGGLVGGFLRYGGTAVFKHSILRLLLRFRCHTPWDFAAALDQAVSRTLMTRVGGGYRFYHRLLQEHFAEHETPELPVAPILGPQSDGDRGGRRAREAH